MLLHLTRLKKNYWKEDSIFDESQQIKKQLGKISPLDLKAIVGVKINGKKKTCLCEDFFVIEKFNTFSLKGEPFTKEMMVRDKFLFVSYLMLFCYDTKETLKFFDLYLKVMLKNQPLSLEEILPFSNIFIYLLYFFVEKEKATVSYVFQLFTPYLETVLKEYVII